MVDRGLTFINLVVTRKVLYNIGKLHGLQGPSIHLAWQSYVGLCAFELFKVNLDRGWRNFRWLQFCGVRSRSDSQRLSLEHE